MYEHQLYFPLIIQYFIVNLLIIFFIPASSSVCHPRHWYHPDMSIKTFQNFSLKFGKDLLEIIIPLTETLVPPFTTVVDTLSNVGNIHYAASLVLSWLCWRQNSCNTVYRNCNMRMGWAVWSTVFHLTKFKSNKTQQSSHGFSVLSKVSGSDYRINYIDYGSGSNLYYTNYEKTSKKGKIPL